LNISKFLGKNNFLLSAWVILFLGFGFVRLEISSEVRLGTRLGILLGIHGGRLRLGIAWSRQLGTTFGQLGGWSGQLGISSGQLGHVSGISVVQVGQLGVWSGQLGISSGQLGHVSGISVVQVGQFQFLRLLV
jgi:hypothetical protein